MKPVVTSTPYRSTSPCFGASHVGGQKAVCLGLVGIQRYIQRRNVVFEHEPSDPRELACRIETILQEIHGFRVPPLVKSREELARIAAANPFATP